MKSAPLISQLAKVSKKARIASSVAIGDFTIINDNVVLEEGVVVESHCVLGHPCQTNTQIPLFIGEGGHIRSHSVFYEGSTFGAGLRTGHRVTVREQIKAGVDLQLGTLSDLQGYMEIGDHVRTHSDVHICQHSRIGNCVWIFPGTVFTNDPHPPSDGCTIGVNIEDYAVIASHCTLAPGIRIGMRALVGAHSFVVRDIAQDTVVSGNPARPICKTSDIQLKDGRGNAYPWTRHFHRGYPDELIQKWITESERVKDYQ